MLLFFSLKFPLYSNLFIIALKIVAFGFKFGKNTHRKNTFCEKEKKMHRNNRLDIRKIEYS